MVIFPPRIHDLKRNWKRIGIGREYFQQALHLRLGRGAEVVLKVRAVVDVERFDGEKIFSKTFVWTFPRNSTQIDERRLEGLI